MIVGISTDDTAMVIETIERQILIVVLDKYNTSSP